jgi:diacylglycerol kinase family enzyme
VLLLVNSSASSVTARGRVVIQKALSADHEVTLAETSRRGHATRLAQAAATDGTDVVVVLGGDGTMNEAANGLAGTDTALAALPGGSTNVFARTLGLPDDPIEATGVLLEALARNSVRRVGLGVVNGRYFLFHAGMGFDAAIVARVDRRASLKRYASHPLFLFSAVETWFRHYDHSRPRFAVHLSATTRPDSGTGSGSGSSSETTVPAGTVTVDDVYFGICLNTNPYTYLGTRPLNLAPDTTLDTGLAMLSVRSLSFTTIIGLAASALASGDHLRNSRQVDYRTDVAALTIEGYGPFPYQVDGEYLGEVTSLDFRHDPEAIALVIP